MAKADSGSVKKETMYIGIGIALVVGVLLGIVFSSFKSGTIPLSGQQASQPQQGQGPGLSQQQASQIMDLEQRVAANPQDVEAWTQLGHVYFDTDRPEQAIRAYSKSLELRPDNPDVLTDLGVMYRRAGRFQEAIASFDKASALGPRHEQSRFNKGIVLMYDLGDIPAAIAAWEDLLKVNPMAQTGNGVPISQLIEEARAQLKGEGQ
jgi:cytochrome c-type biogenesis protein CcmH/NrfG